MAKRTDKPWKESGEYRGVDFVIYSHHFPMIDVKINFKAPDGSFQELRVTARIATQPGSPEVWLLLGGGHSRRQRLEFQVPTRFRFRLKNTRGLHIYVDGCRIFPQP